MSDNPEIVATTERLRQAGETIQQQANLMQDQATLIKGVADKLREDVDALASRVSAIEVSDAATANNLIDNTERIRTEQGHQDNRLDTLEQ